MKKLIISAVVLTASLALTGCGGSSGTGSVAQASTGPALSPADQVFQSAGVPRRMWPQLALVHADAALKQNTLGTGVPIVFADQSDLGKSTAPGLLNQPYFSGVDRFFNNGGDTTTLQHDVTVAELASGYDEGIAPHALIYNGSTSYLNTAISGQSDVTAAQSANGDAGVGGLINLSYGGNGKAPLVSVLKANSVLATLTTNDELLVQAAGDTAVPLCGGQGSLYLTGAATAALSGVSCTDLSGDQTKFSSAPAFLDPRTKDNYLIAGETSVSTPGTPTPQGTFPGSNAAVEATFIVAPGYNVISLSGGGDGTS